MFITVVLLTLWVWLWIRFVIVKAFPFMDRVNQFLLGLLAGVVTQVLLSLFYWMVFVR